MDLILEDVSSVMIKMKQYNVEDVVDANRVFEKLEIHADEKDRVSAVVTELIAELGLPHGNDSLPDVILIPGQGNENSSHQPLLNDIQKETTKVPAESFVPLDLNIISSENARGTRSDPSHTTPVELTPKTSQHVQLPLSSSLPETKAPQNSSPVKPGPSKERSEDLSPGNGTRGSLSHTGAVRKKIHDKFNMYRRRESSDSSSEEDGCWKGNKRVPVSKNNRWARSSGVETDHISKDFCSKSPSKPNTYFQSSVPEAHGVESSLNRSHMKRPGAGQSHGYSGSEEDSDISHSKAADMCLKQEPHNSAENGKTDILFRYSYQSKRSKESKHSPHKKVKISPATQVPNQSDTVVNFAVVPGAEVMDLTQPRLGNVEDNVKMLREMFPEADPKYLHEQCVTLEDEGALNRLVERMLTDDKYPRSREWTIQLKQVTGAHADVSAAAGSAADLERKAGTIGHPANEIPPTSKPQSPKRKYSETDNVEAKQEPWREQLGFLESILPDADPTFLEEKARLLHSNDDMLRQFVADALENKNYPSRKDWEWRQEQMALLKKYKEEFSVENFLELIPDPFNYFETNKKVNRDLGTMFLRNKYRKLRLADIYNAYSKHQHNLTLTCRFLDEWQGPTLKSRRADVAYDITRKDEKKGIDVPFLQEVAFIENKDKIVKYLDEKKEQRKAAFEMAKSKGELLECQCCFDSEVLSDDISTCTEGHTFCKECVRNGAEARIGDGKTTFPCLTDCVAEFKLHTLQEVLKPTVFSRLVQRKQAEEVKAAGIEDLVQCPFCDFCNIPPKEDKVFRCLNPDCMKESCRLCQEENHIPLRCDEVEKAPEVAARKFIEDKMTEALVRTCWKCQKKFVKEDGCNKMTCQCGAMMCYICRKPVQDYSHFNGQGGDAYHKCPLFSHNNELHVVEIEKIAQQAKEEILAKNPTMKLKHDPTQILPKATPGPGLAGEFVMNLHRAHEHRRARDERRIRQIEQALNDRRVGHERRIRIYERILERYAGQGRHQDMALHLLVEARRLQNRGRNAHQPAQPPNNERQPADPPQNNRPDVAQEPVPPPNIIHNVNVNNANVRPLAPLNERMFIRDQLIPQYGAVNPVRLNQPFQQNLADPNIHVYHMPRQNHWQELVQEQNCIAAAVVPLGAQQNNHITVHGVGNGEHNLPPVQFAPNVHQNYMFNDPMLLQFHGEDPFNTPGK